MKEREWPQILRHYRQEHRPRNQAELDWFRRQPTLEAAISNATFARDALGKRYSHQCRIPERALAEASRRLFESLDVLRRFRSFEELHGFIRVRLEEVRGLGELYAYDTALRIGAKLGFLPTRVYLHAGTRVGARRLGIDGRMQSVDIDALPSALDHVPPHEIEDILCIYAAELPWHRA